MPLKLSIIIPVFNEEKTLLTILKKVQNISLKNIQKEIIIVDDYSTDSSRVVMGDIKDTNVKIVYHKRNIGKGGAVRTGFKHATGDIVLIQDADLEYSPEDYSKLLEPILDKKTEVVFGSRFTKKHKARYKFYYVGNLVISLFASIMFFRRLTDVETCYKVFTKKAIGSIAPILKEKGFGIEPEMVAKLVKNKFKIIEVPISYKCRSFDEGKKITWADGVKALWYLLKYRFVD